MVHIKDFVTNPPSNPFFGVIGHPIAQSKSPLLHNLALNYHRIVADYYKIDTPSDSFAWVGKLVTLPGFRGLNVTIPHKSRVMDMLSFIDPKALQAGVVNTIKPEHLGFAGYNTDILGVERSILPHALLITGRPALVFGSGGAAKAVVAALKSCGITEAYIVSRKNTLSGWPSKLNGVTVHLADYLSLEEPLKNSSLVVNTTPLGMFPKTDDSPVPSKMVRLLKEKVCMDAIYNPQETLFLKQAKEAKALKTISGVTMFVEQAAASFKIWTGKDFPVDEARTLLIKSL